MWIYLLLFAVVVFLCFRELQGERLTASGLAWALGGLALFVGLGDMLGGYDRYIYAEIFDGMADSLHAGTSGFWDLVNDFYYSDEKGYALLNALIGLFTRNRYIFIFLITIIVYFNLYQHFKRYVQSYSFALLLFLGFWFFFSFTYLRQVLGATFVWYGIKYVLERKPWHFFAVVLLAYSIHNSALIFAPLYFVPIRQFKKETVLMVVFLMFVLGASGLPSAVFDAYDATLERSRAGWGGDSAQWMYLVESAVLLYFIFKNYNRLYETQEMSLMTNMAIVFCSVLVLFYHSDNGGRLSWYYMIGIISTMSTLACNQYEEETNSGSLVSRIRANQYTNVIMVLCFTLFFRIVMAWGVLLSPYKTFLTPGVREGDFIEAFYEYDHGYDDNKFYR